jgi:ribonuclease BN (tRNA processing enzyme)
MIDGWRTPNDLAPDQLHLLPLGVGNAFTDRYFHSSFILFAGTTPILVDCPSPLRRIVRDAAIRSRLAIDVLNIDHVLLTHLHGDHCNGIEEFAYMKKYLDCGRQAHLYLLPELIGPLWENRLKASMGGRPGEEPRTLDDYYEVHRLPPGTANRIAPGPKVFVEAYRTAHPVPTAALRISFGRTRFGYSADTPFDRKLIDFLAPCDFIIHEVATAATAAVHTPQEDLERLPDELKRKIHLIHIPDDLRQEDTSMQILEEGRLYPIPIPQATDPYDTLSMERAARG